MIIIKGIVPHTLSKIESKEISYLHIDLNCARPEVEALDFLWSRIGKGSFVLLDDYGYEGHDVQNKAMNEYCSRHDINVLSLPTGQGLIIK